MLGGNGMDWDQIYVTVLLAHGEHPKVVQERLGHHDPAFTLRVYSHVLPGMQAQAAARLEARLFGAQLSNLGHDPA